MHSLGINNFTFSDDWDNILFIFLIDFNIGSISIDDLDFVYKMQDKIRQMKCFDNILDFNVNVQDRIRLVLGLVLNFLYIFNNNSDIGINSVFYDVYEQYQNKSDIPFDADKFYNNDYKLRI